MHPIPCRLFSAWLFLLSISPTVGHAHAGGGGTHTHSLGALELNQPTPDDAEVFHWHLLLLGLEVHLPPGTSPSESPPCSSDAPTIDVGAVLDEAAPVASTVDLSLDFTAAAVSETLVECRALPIHDAPFVCLSSADLLRTTILIV